MLFQLLKSVSISEMKFPTIIIHLHKECCTFIGQINTWLNVSMLLNHVVLSCCLYYFSYTQQVMMTLTLMHLSLYMYVRMNVCMWMYECMYVCTYICMFISLKELCKNDKYKKRQQITVTHQKFNTPGPSQTRAVQVHGVAPRTQDIKPFINCFN